MAQKRLASYRGPSCPHCKKALDLDAMTDGMVWCPHCGHDFEARVFRPTVRNARVQQLSQSGPEAAGACANHPRNAATTSCDRCGIFICALCELNVDAAKYCPACFDRLAQEGAIASAQVRFRDFGGLASIAALAGMILFPLMLAFGVLSLYYVIKGIRQRKEAPSSSGRLLISLLAAFLEIIFGFAMLVGMLAAWKVIPK